jgi:hypothetical protein
MSGLATIRPEPAFDLQPFWMSALASIEDSPGNRRTCRRRSPHGMNRIRGWCSIESQHFHWLNTRGALYRNPAGRHTATPAKARPPGTESPDRRERRRRASPAGTVCISELPPFRRRFPPAPIRRPGRWNRSRHVVLRYNPLKTCPWSQVRE